MVKHRHVADWSKGLYASITIKMAIPILRNIKRGKNIIFNFLVAFLR